MRLPSIKFNILIVVFLITSIFLIFILRQNIFDNKKQGFSCNEIISLKEKIGGSCHKGHENYNVCYFFDDSFINCDINDLKKGNLIKIYFEEKFFPENISKICYHSDLIDFFSVYDSCQNSVDVIRKSEKCESIRFSPFEFFFIGFVDDKSDENKINLINISLFSENKKVGEFSLEGIVNE